MMGIYVFLSLRVSSLLFKLFVTFSFFLGCMCIDPILLFLAFMAMYTLVLLADNLLSVVLFRALQGLIHTDRLVARKIEASHSPG